MERKIGEVFTDEGNRIRVVKDGLCNECFYNKGGGNSCAKELEIVGYCSKTMRDNKEGVIFKKIEK